MVLSSPLVKSTSTITIDMKTLEELKKEGYNFKAYSSNGAFKITSYIAHIKGRRVYGYWSEALSKYVEEPT